MYTKCRMGSSYNNNNIKEKIYTAITSHACKIPRYA